MAQLQAAAAQLHLKLLHPLPQVIALYIGVHLENLHWFLDVDACHSGCQAVLLCMCVGFSACV